MLNLQQKTPRFGKHSSNMPRMSPCQIGMQSEPAKEFIGFVKDSPLPTEFPKKKLNGLLGFSGLRFMVYALFY